MLLHYFVNQATGMACLFVPFVLASLSCQASHLEMAEERLGGLVFLLIMETFIKIRLTAKEALAQAFPHRHIILHFMLVKGFCSYAV